MIRPYDQGSVKDIEKAIRSSDLGMAPNSDGKVIRLQVPAMSGEQRQKMVARVKKASEDAKVACRNIRRDANKQFDTAEKDKEMTEVERDNGKEKVQDLLKSFEDKITDLEAEIHFRPITPPQRPDARQQFRKRERLGQVVIRSAVQPADLHINRIASSQ